MINLFVLKKPIPYCIITQPFGVNWTAQSNAYTQFGIMAHNGIDLRLSIDKKIYACHDGKVIFSGKDKYLGYMVEIINNELGIKTRYAHGDKLFCNTGDNIKTGDYIMHGDNTGFSTGEHLHFDIKLINKEGNVLNYSNGYKGAVNPMIYFEKDFLNMPVDDYYGQKRTYKTYLKERVMSCNPWLIKKLGRLPTHREIKMLIYGFWDFDKIKDKSWYPITNWLTKSAYQKGEKPFIRQS